MSDRTKVYFTYVFVDEEDRKKSELDLAEIQSRVDRLYACPTSMVELIIDSRIDEDENKFGIEIHAYGGNSNEIEFALVAILDTLAKRAFDKYANFRPIGRRLQTAITGM